MKLSKSRRPHSALFFTQTNYRLISFTGDDRDRTGDLWLAKPPLSQLSYIPADSRNPMGLNGVEPLTSRLSGARSNQLSYRPVRRHLQYGRIYQNSRAEDADMRFVCCVARPDMVESGKGLKTHLSP